VTSTTMTDWLMRPRYLLGFLVFVVSATWLVLVVPHYTRPEDLSTLDLLSCRVAGIGCATAEERYGSLLANENRLKEELVALEKDGGGDAVLQRLEELRSAELTVQQTERGAPWAAVPLIASAVVAQLALAVLAASLAWGLLRRLLARWCSEKIRSSRESIGDTLEHLQTWPRDLLLRILADPEAAGLGGRLGVNLKTLQSELEDLTSQRLRERDRRGQTVDWTNISKLLYTTALVLRQKQRAAGVLEPGEALQLEQAMTHVHDQYRRVRRVIRWDTFQCIASAVLPLTLVFVAFWAVGQALAASPGAWGTAGDVLAHGWLHVLGFLLLGLGGARAFYRGARPCLLWLTEKTTTQLDDVVAMAVVAPLAAAGLALCVHFAVGFLPPYFLYGLSRGLGVITEGGLPLLLTAILGTWLLVVIFNRVILFAMDRWAENTEQQYDDMFVRLLRIFGTFFILAIVGALLLIRFQAQIREVAGIDSVLLPYAIVVSVATAFLGYSAREGVENFFGALMLQIDKPFERGDRLMLDSGEVCDVRSIGMRSTKLYDVMASTEISVPNRVMVSQKITNVSRPDLQLRISVRLRLPVGGVDLRRVEAALLDAAYFDPEVDQSRVGAREVSEDQRKETGREGLLTLVERLGDAYPHVKELKAERVLGRGNLAFVAVFPALPDRLRGILELRREYGRLLQEGLPIVAGTPGPLQVNETNWPGVKRLLEYFSAKCAAPGQTPDKDGCEAIVHDSLRGTGLEGEAAQLVGIMECLPGTATGPSTPEESSPGSSAGGSFSRSLHLARGWLADNRHQRYAKLLQISDAFAEIGEYLYTIRDAHTQAREIMDRLVGELNKEPTVHSEFVTGNDGALCAEITLWAFATHLERRHEIHHKLDKDLQDFLWLEALL